VKRRIALGFLAFLLLTVGGALWVASTPWAGRKLCDLAEAKAREAAGLEIAFGSCRVRPLRLAVDLTEVRVGPPGKPVFAADSISVRLAPLQALSKTLALDEVSIVRPRVNLVLPPPRPGEKPAPCPPPLLQHFHLRRLQVEDGTASVTLPGGEEIVVGRVDVRSKAEWIPTDLESLTTGARRSRVTVELGPTLLEAGGRQTLLDQASLEADFAFDLSRLAVRSFRAEGEGVKVSAHGTVSNLCNPRLGLEIEAEAPLPALLSLARVQKRSAGSASVKLQVSGPADKLDAAGQVRVSGARFGPYTPGDTRVAFRLRGTDLEVSSVEVPLSGGSGIVARATVRLAPPASVVAEAELKQVEFAELVSRLGLEGAHVMMKLDAHVKVEGPLSPLRLAGTAEVDARDFRVLDRSWERWRPGLETVLDLPRGRIEAPVVITDTGAEVGEGGKAFAGDGILGVRGRLSFEDTGGFDLALDGSVDLSALRHIASVPMAGKGTFRGTAVAIPYGPPRIEGALTVRDFHFLQLDLGDVTATALATPDLVLRVRDGVGRKAESSYTVDTTIDLGATPMRILPSQATARGRLRDLFDVVIPWLPSARLFQDAIDGSVQVSMPFEGEIPKVNMSFEGTLGRGTLWGKGYDWGRIGARIVEGEKAIIDTAELHRGDSVAEGTGTVHFPAPSPWSLAVHFTDLALDGLSLPGDGWGGTVDGEATFGGSVEHPDIKFSLTGDEVRAIGIPIGAVDAEGVLRGRELSIRAGTAGVTFTSRALLEGAKPYEASADIDVEDLTRFLPGGPPAGLRAQAHGRATSKGNLEEVLESQARLVLDRVRLGYADFRVGNKDPVVLAVSRQRMVVESFTLQGTNTEFSATGARARDGALDFAGAGTIDLRLLGGLLPAIVKTHGQLAVDASVTGTFDDPHIVGGGRLSDAGFRFREMPIEFASMAGDLAFSQNLVLFEKLSATVNGAPTHLRGEVGLSRFVPRQIRVEADLDRVPVAIPSWLPTTLSGKLEAFGSLDAMTLAGTLRVVAARYTEPFDLDKRILQVGAAPAAPPRAYDPSGEWLKFDIRFLVDGDARIDNDLVRGQARGELLLTGNLAAIGMTGNLAFLPGARGFYRGNEFVLSRAVVDFTERNRLRMVLDVTGEAALKDYRVFLHVFGDMDDLKLQLTSTPMLSQQDIITLLSLGYTSRDATVGSNLGVAAGAAAAQALFSVSGLEQQLRRFVPQTGVFQDVNVRLTSAYSKTSLTVEPRWEFETKALDGKLRVRYQAPLSNQTRGQKAQVEYRLSDRAGIQVQWDNDNTDVSGGDLGADFKLRWEWSD
jgi:translocation and assembly module TamB